MKLSTKDRLIMSGLYPRESNIIDQVLIKDIKIKVDLTQSEFKAIDFKIVGDKYTWNNKKGKDKEIDFTAAELNLLRTQIDKMDKEKKITQEILSLCLRIKENQSNRQV